ncbi:MAG: MmgE/PrpD family protein, partial [Chloroflexi bacterium]|nr:MmgE/PrpD family protein [Chloroflexota bacterium]
DSDEPMLAPDVRALMERTTVEVASDLDGMASRTAIVTHDGPRLEREVLLPKGEPENPMSQDEAEAKFIEWTEPVLGPRKTQDLARQVAGLERLGTMAELTRSLRLQAPSTGRR